MFKNFHFKNVFSSSCRILTPGYLNEFSHCAVVCIKCKGHAILLLKAKGQCWSPESSNMLCYWFCLTDICLSP